MSSDSCENKYNYRNYGLSWKFQGGDEVKTKKSVLCVSVAGRGGGGGGVEGTCMDIF